MFEFFMVNLKIDWQASSEATFLNLFIVVLTAAFQGYVNSVREHQVCQITKK